MPWIPKAVWALIVSDREQRAREYADLLTKYDALRLTGAVAPDPIITPSPREADPVMQAITAVCGTDKRLRAVMARQVMRDRSLGVSDDDIIRTIQQGVPDDLGLPA